MDYLDFKKLLAFFSALKDSGFRRTLKEIPSFTIINKQRVPVDKASCLELLRLLPDFQGDNFKDDNNIIKYLSDPRNRDRILGKFSREQQIELTKALEEKPISSEAISEQTSEGAAAEQVPAAGTTTEAASGGLPGGFPAGPRISSSPRITRIIHEVPQTPKPEIAIANKSGMVTGMRDIKSPSWLKTFGSNAQIFTKRNLERIGKGIFGAAKTGLETANPFLGRMGTGLVNGLTNIAKLGGTGGVGSRSIFGRFGRGGGRTEFSVGKTVKGRGGLIFAVSIIGFMIIVGGLAITGASSAPGGTTPNPTPVPSYQPGAGRGIISCPLNGGSITTGSKDAPGGRGHCSPEYQKDYPCASPDVTGRATAVDLEGPDKSVFLPRLNGEKVTWAIDESGTVINENEGGGFALAATASSKGKTYTVRYVHINQPALIVGNTPKSDDFVGQYLTHVHVTLQEDGVFRPGDLYFNLCQ